MTMAMMQLATMGMSMIAGVDGCWDDGDVVLMVVGMMAMLVMLIIVR